MADNVTIENCEFKRTGPIKIESGYTLNVWSEGYGAANMVIRGNTFDSVNLGGSHTDKMKPAISVRVYLKSDPSSEGTAYPLFHDILVERNKFVNLLGAMLHVSSSRNVIVRDNLIVKRRGTGSSPSYLGSVGAVCSSDIFVTGNKWIADAPSPESGLLYDKETVKNAYSWDNSSVSPERD